DAARSARSSAGRTPSGSTWRSNRSLAAFLAAAVRAARSSVLAHEWCAAIFARRVRCAGVNPVLILLSTAHPCYRSEPLNPITETELACCRLRAFVGSRRTVALGHLGRLPAENAHHVALATSLSLPMMGSRVPTQVCVQVPPQRFVDPGFFASAGEPLNEAVR